MESKYLLSALVRRDRRERAKEDIEYFIEYYLPHFLENDTPYFHKEIRKLLATETRLGIAAPRGFAKSTNVQLIYGIYCLLFHPGEDILSISQSAAMAEDWIRKIKFELEGNERIVEDFGAILQWGEKNSKRWTSDHILLQKEGRVYSQMRARGRGCQVRGLRPTKVFCDDLEDDELCRSDEQRKYLKEWFLGALLNVLKSDQQLVVIGTMLHPLALLEDIIQKKDEFAKWTTKKYKALENGKSLWEARFPVKALEQTRLEIGTHAFEKEFQNNPLSSDICLWRPEWIIRYDKLPEIKVKFATLDPAASEKQSADCSALCCMGVGVDGHIYELESLKGRWGTWDLVDRFIQFYQRHHPIRFGVEEQAFQSILRKVLIKEAEAKGIRLPIEKVSLGRYTDHDKRTKAPTDKYTRALSVIHLFEQGLVHLKSQHLIEQLSLFPTGSEDDLVDACVFALRMILKYSPNAVIIQKPEFKEIKSFEVKDDTMPCLAKIDNLFKGGKDWRVE